MWRSTLILMLSVAVQAAPKPAVAPPITLPDKYTPIFYEHLTGFEHERCERYVNELKLMETRKQMGVQKWELEKMKTRAERIEREYDRYCLKLRPQSAG